MTAQRDAEETGREGCPECAQPLPAGALARQLFCTTACREAWHNRWTKRGRVAAVLETAAWITRRGSRGDRETGRAALLANNRLKQTWINEDRAAGRMAADRYLRLRIRNGFDLT